MVLQIVSQLLGPSPRDPISSLLFLLIMEVFIRMLLAATSAGLLSGFSVARRNSTTINVSHVLFADDTIFFCDNDCEQMVNLPYILIWFEASTSQLG